MGADSTIARETRRRFPGHEAGRFRVERMTHLSRHTTADPIASGCTAPRLPAGMGRAALDYWLEFGALAGRAAAVPGATAAEGG